MQSTTYVPEEKEYLANCMKYTFHLKGVFAIPWNFPAILALEYGQEIARIMGIQPAATDTGWALIPGHQW